MKFPAISVCTAGPAIGHDCFIDSKTLTQIMEIGNANSPVKVFPDHNETVTDLIGAMSNFYLDGDQVKADLDLIEENPLSGYYAKILEIFPDSIGFSIAWAGSLEEVEGKNYARVESLTSVDLVSQPAANPTGVYSAKIQSKKLKSNKGSSEKGKSPEEVAETALPHPIEEMPSDVAETMPDVIDPDGQGQVDKSPLDTMANPDSNQPPVTAEEALSTALSKALSPITEALSAISEKLASMTPQNNPDQYEDGEGEDEGMSKGGKASSELSAIRAELAAIREAGTGSAPVSGGAFEKAPADLAAAYEAIESPKEKASFAKKHFTALKAILPKSLK